MPTVSVKWQKELYEHIEIDTSQPPSTFKDHLYELTGVPPERQTVYLKGAILKDDSEWSKLGVKEGQKILMVSDADKIVKDSKKGYVSMEDLPEEQATAPGHSIGLCNLGNTCYVNATMQCLYSIPELKSALVGYPQAGKSNDIDDASYCLTVATRELFNELNKSVEPVKPTKFLMALRKKFPKFDESQNGIFAQQDAEECLTQIMCTLSQSLRSPTSSSVNIDVVKRHFAIDITSSVRCVESSEESSETESLFSLKCYINDNVNNLHEGLKEGLRSELEKESPELGRNAVYIKDSRIDGLPKYLTVHLVRLAWNKESKQNEKITKKVYFPLELDILDLCTDNLYKTLEISREMLSDEDGGQGSSKAATGEDLGGIYDLVTVLTHKGGSADSGHYAAWVKQENGNWTLFDDDISIQQSEDDIMNLYGGWNWHMAYVCMYKARPITMCARPSRVESVTLTPTLTTVKDPQAQKLTLVGNPKKPLKPHQLDGVEWLWYLHLKGKGGGLVADEMGLGKTLQTCVFVVSLLKAELIKRVLVIVPGTLLGTWSNEFQELGVVVSIYHGRFKDQRLAHLKENNGILLTTYETYNQNKIVLPSVWDYVIIDEGHMIKNLDTQRSQSIRSLHSDHRLILTGTPIEKEIDEIYSLLSFCVPAIFNDLKDFRKSLKEPLKDKLVDEVESYFSETVAVQSLKSDMEPYVLRRLAADVLPLPKKHEFTVWLKLSCLQQHLYRSFLDVAKNAISEATFAAIDILKKVCDDPVLVQMAEDPKVEPDLKYSKGDVGSRCLWSMIRKIMQEYDAETDFQSVKLQFLNSFVRDLCKNGHSVLIFAQRKHMLNKIEDVIKPLQCGRLEGGRSLNDRTNTIKLFEDGKFPVLLIQSKVGSVGLTLTRADSVIIVDPAWNPSTDNQSICRAYRQGQKSQVMVYRLITSGTVEERMYQKQIRKMQLAKRVLDTEDPYSYFNREEVGSMFIAGNFNQSETEIALSTLHEKPDAFVQSEMDAIRDLPHTTGVTYHSLLFSIVASRDDTRDVKVVFNPKEVVTHRNRTIQTLSKRQTKIRGGKKAPEHQNPKELSKDEKWMKWCADVLDKENKTLERLQRLQTIGDELSREEVLSRISNYLHTLGLKIDYIVKREDEADLSQRERMTRKLWNYVSTFSKLSGDKLQDIYLKLKQQKGTAAGVGSSQQ